MKYMSKRDEVAAMIKMREAGATYEQIGAVFGVTRQAVYQRLRTRCSCNAYKRSPVLAAKWPCVDAYIKEHDMTLTGFSEKCGVKKSRMTSCLYGGGRFRAAEARRIAAIVGDEFLNHF